MAAATAPALLLDVDADADHHRAVVSICGVPDRVEEGLLAAIAEAALSIDLRRHAGVHPRTGAADVVPLVPLVGALEETAEDARRLGARIWRELGIPVYLYGAAVGGPPLAEIRAGRARFAHGRAPHPSAGAVAVGARPALVAYNVLLERATATTAAALARSVRASTPGGLPGVQALAFQLGDGTWQLSMNLIDIEAAPPARVHEEVRRRAAAAGLETGLDEVVGLCPARCAPRAADGRVLEAREAAAVARAAGLGDVAARLAVARADAAELRAAGQLIAGLAVEDPQLRAVRDHATAALGELS